MNSKKRQILFLLLTLVVAVSTILVACVKSENEPPKLPAEKGEAIMEKMDPEVLEANSKAIEGHLNSIEFNERYESHKDLARFLAKFLGTVCDKRIETVASKPQGKGTVLTITDQTGKEYIIGLGEYGAVNTIKDNEGNILTGIVQ